MIEKFIKSFIHHFGNVLRFIQLAYLKSTGVRIGKNTMISLRAKIDVRRGQVTIGDNCHITYGCVLLSHDGSTKQHNPSDDGSGYIKVGNNVFIGVNSIVMRNVSIGDNSIIGAGSVVTRNIPSGVIASGNPARIVRRIEPK